MQAGEAVTASPEVRGVAIPHTGARLVIASDGLWDAVQPKTALHHVRSLVANKAATELVRACTACLCAALPHQVQRQDDIGTLLGCGAAAAVPLLVWRPPVARDTVQRCFILKLRSPALSSQSVRGTKQFNVPRASC